MTWRIPFIDLRPTEVEKKQLTYVISKVMDHGQFILGPEVELLEKNVSSFCGRHYAVGVSSGTDALYLGLRSLDIGPNDEVIVPALSWIATANAVTMTGAIPVFCDIGNDLNMDKNAAAKLIGPRTRAILCVHYGGRLCDIVALKMLAVQYKLHFLEDASQAFGAERNGHISGGVGDISMFSLNPMKVFGACGEAGILLTDNEDVYQRVLRLRNNGIVNKLHCVEASLNSRIDTIQAAILLMRLGSLKERLKYREVLALRYSKQLHDLVRVPEVLIGERHVYYSYIIRTKCRNDLLNYLCSRGVEAKIRDSVLMPEQPYYRSTMVGSYPTAQGLVHELLYLPMHDRLCIEDIDLVANMIKQYFH